MRLKLAAIVRTGLAAVMAALLLPAMAAAQETALAQDMAEAGATAIIGTHPHVVQPEAMLTTRDGRTVPIVYSLGNFVSYQIGLPRLATAIYLLGFTPAVLDDKVHKLEVRVKNPNMRVRARRSYVASVDPEGRDR